MPEATVVDTTAEVPIYLEAFERHAATIRALSSDDLEPVNLESLFAVQATQKSLVRVKPMRSRLIEELTRFKVANLDNLLDYSHCFAHATTLLRAAAPQVSGFEALATECGEVLGKMEAYLRAAIEAGVIPAASLAELKGGTGHRNTVHDLLLIAQTYRANWSKIEGKTFYTQAEIRHADALAARLNAAVADRESKPSGFEDVSLERQKAFTLFYRAYMHVRNAVEYLLKEDGQLHLLEEIMPSLHTYRVSRKRGAGAAEEELTQSVPAVSTDLTVATQPASPRTKVGMPDSDPFTP